MFSMVGPNMLSTPQPPPDGRFCEHVAAIIAGNGPVFPTLPTATPLSSQAPGLFRTSLNSGISVQGQGVPGGGAGQDSQGRKARPVMFVNLSFTLLQAVAEAWAFGLLQSMASQ